MTNEVEARYGEKMIQVNVRFWTNDIAEGDGKIVPKHGWGCGVVVMERNDSHGIKSGDPIPFKSMADLPAAIEKLLGREGITLYLTGPEGKYRANDE